MHKVFGKKESKEGKNSDELHCDLCGSLTPAVRCDKCNNQIFCLSCDDMYHRHPKRKLHLRKAVDSVVTPRPSSKPPPGDPSKMPTAPPRKKKPKSFLGTLVRGSPLNSPHLPKKEFSFVDKLGSIKRFMINRPLPPLPPESSSSSASESHEDLLYQNVEHNLFKRHSTSNPNLSVNGGTQPQLPPKQNTNILANQTLRRGPGSTTNLPCQKLSYIHNPMLCPSPTMSPTSQHLSVSTSDLTSPSPNEPPLYPSPYPHFPSFAPMAGAHSMAHLNCYYPTPWMGAPIQDMTSTMKPSVKRSQSIHQEGYIPPAGYYPYMPPFGAPYYPHQFQAPPSPSLSLRSGLRQRKRHDDSASVASSSCSHGKSSSSSRSLSHSKRKGKKPPITSETDDDENEDVLEDEAADTPSSKGRDDDDFFSFHEESEGGKESDGEYHSEDDTISPWVPSEIWVCEFCTFVNDPGSRICNVCCKTISRIRPPSNKSKLKTENKQSPKSDSRKVISNNEANLNSQTSKQRKLNILKKSNVKNNSNVENDKTEISHADENEIKLLENNSLKLSKLSNGNLKNTEIILNGNHTTVTKTNGHDMDQLTSALEEAEKQITRGLEELFQARESNASKIKAPASCNVDKPSLTPTPSSPSLKLFRQGSPQREIKPTLVETSPLAQRRSLVRSLSRVSLMNQSTLESTPLSGSKIRSLSRASLMTDFQDPWIESPLLRRPDYYLSVEELVEKRRQETMKAQGLELVRMIREAEKRGYTADDLQVALGNCGSQHNALDWLEKNWKNMIETVITLATNYGHDKSNNDVGIISPLEAQEALRIHKGNIWAAVTECVESRQRKFLELSAQGNFNRKEIIAALTLYQGKVDLAYTDLIKANSNPFMINIWGSGCGVENAEMPIKGEDKSPDDNVSDLVSLGESASGFTEEVFEDLEPFEEEEILTPISSKLYSPSLSKNTEAKKAGIFSKLIALQKGHKPKEDKVKTRPLSFLEGLAHNEAQISSKTRENHPIETESKKSSILSKLGMKSSNVALNATLESEMPETKEKSSKPSSFLQRLGIIDKIVDQNKAKPSDITENVSKTDHDIKIEDITTNIEQTDETDHLSDSYFKESHMGSIDFIDDLKDSRKSSRSSSLAATLNQLGLSREAIIGEEIISEDNEIQTVSDQHSLIAAQDTNLLPKVSKESFSIVQKLSMLTKMNILEKSNDNLTDMNQNTTNTPADDSINAPDSNPAAFTTLDPLKKSTIVESTILTDDIEIKSNKKETVFSNAVKSNNNPSLDLSLSINHENITEKGNLANAPKPKLSEIKKTKEEAATSNKSPSGKNKSKSSKNIKNIKTKSPLTYETEPASVINKDKSPPLPLQAQDIVTLKENLLNHGAEQIIPLPSVLKQNKDRTTSPVPKQKSVTSDTGEKSLDNNAETTYPSSGSSEILNKPDLERPFYPKQTAPSNNKKAQISKKSNSSKSIQNQQISPADSNEKTPIESLAIKEQDLATIANEKQSPKQTNQPNKTPSSKVNIEMPNSKPYIRTEKSLSPKPEIKSEKPSSPEPNIPIEKPLSPKPDIKSEKPSPPKPIIPTEKPSSPKPDIKSEKPSSPKPNIPTEKPLSPKPDINTEKPVSPKPNISIQKPTSTKSKNEKQTNVIIEPKNISSPELIVQKENIKRNSPKSQPKDELKINKDRVSSIGLQGSTPIDSFDDNKQFVSQEISQDLTKLDQTKLDVSKKIQTTTLPTSRPISETSGNISKIQESTSSSSEEEEEEEEEETDSYETDETEDEPAISTIKSITKSSENLKPEKDSIDKSPAYTDLQKEVDIKDNVIDKSLETSSAKSIEYDKAVESNAENSNESSNNINIDNDRKTAPEKKSLIPIPIKKEGVKLQRSGSLVSSMKEKFMSIPEDTSFNKFKKIQRSQSLVTSSSIPILIATKFSIQTEEVPSIKSPIKNKKIPEIQTPIKEEKSETKEPVNLDIISEKASSSNSSLEIERPINPILSKVAIIRPRSPTPVRSIISQQESPLIARKPLKKVILVPKVAKKDLEFEKKVERLLDEKKCANQKQAEMAARLLDMNFEEEYVLLAASDCSSIDLALTYLQQECELCAGQYAIPQMVPMMYCPHRSCQECLKTYFTIKIRDRNIMELMCPFCNEPDISKEEIAQEYFNHIDLLLKKLVSEEIHELFQQKLRDRVLMKDPNFRWCSKCSSGFIIANPYLKKFACPDCNADTCLHCKKPWEDQHEGISCKDFQVWKDANDSGLEGLANQLMEHGIECPNCHFRYLLAKGGCMHFCCNQCQFDFCSGCGRPFKLGQKCTVSQYCEKLGLHAHHPRNCLFYLRDKDPEELQALLDAHEISYNKLLPEGIEASKKCQVMEQKETPDGLIDEVCNKEVQEGFAGLCRSHYVEYLGQKISSYKLDPIYIFSEDDLELVLRRSNVKLPRKIFREPAEDYKNRLIEIIEKEVPLNKIEGS